MELDIYTMSRRVNTLTDHTTCMSYSSDQSLTVFVKFFSDLATYRGQTHDR